ncbi:MAG: lytic transglycosylase domain-containing protein [Jannaschia sp.]
MLRFVIPACLALAACTSTPVPDTAQSFLQAQSQPALNPGETPEMRSLVNKWAAYYDLPPSLLHRVIQRESDYRAGARNGPYWGIMQILPATARGVGMRGDPAQLLKADTGLKYSARYLRGAWIVSGGDEIEAMMWYAKGYYYEAKRLGLLEETGLRGDLWQRYDRGETAMPRLDARGNVLPAEPACEPNTGLIRVVAGSGC